jgi:hypothetical protein
VLWKATLAQVVAESVTTLGYRPGAGAAGPASRTSPTAELHGYLPNDRFPRVGTLTQSAGSGANTNVAGRAAMRMTLVAIGSYGDVLPFVTLGRHLQECGYEVRVATPITTSRTS